MYKTENKGPPMQNNVRTEIQTVVEANESRNWQDDLPSVLTTQMTHNWSESCRCVLDTT